MDTCKHDWHFIEGTERLRCERCKAETGPKTYEERVQDILQEPRTEDLYTMPLFQDVEKYTMPTDQVYTFGNLKPDYNISFHRVVDGRNTDVVGKLDFNGPELVFTGDADESAKVFIEWIATAFKGRLQDERQAELNACCDLLEGMHAATDGNHNYYLHAANELRKLRKP
jgi:hypothetical protein